MTKTSALFIATRASDSICLQMGSSAEPVDTAISDKFYLDVVVFEVENTIYKILRQPFITTSIVFKEMFETSTTEGLKEGRSDEHPIVLEGTKKADWEFLLTALLTPDVAAVSNFGSLEEWTSLLELSRRWIMKSMHDTASKRVRALLKTSNPVLKIQYGRRYDHSEWLIEGFYDLVRRKKAITPETAQLCQFDELLRIYELRVRQRALVAVEESRCGCLRDDDIDPVDMAEIRSVFERECRRLDDELRRIFE